MTSPGRNVEAGRWYMEVVCCPDHMTFLSAVPTRFEVIQGIMFGASLAAGVTGKLSMLTPNRIQGPTPGFLTEFTSIPFPVFGYDRKAVCVWGGGGIKSGLSSPVSSTLLVMRRHFPAFRVFQFGARLSFLMLFETCLMGAFYRE